MVAGNDHYRDIRQPYSKLLQLIEGVEDRGVSRPNGMEQIASKQHDVRFGLEYGVDRMSERMRNIRLALVDTARCLAVVLTEAKVQVGQVGELHRIRASLGGVW